LKKREAQRECTVFRLGQAETGRRGAGAWSSGSRRFLPLHQCLCLYVHLHRVGGDFHGPRGGIGPTRWGEAKDDRLMRAVSTAGQWQAMRICRLFGTSPQFAVCRDKASASGARDWLLVLQRSRVHQSGISARGTLKVVHHATRTQWTAPRLDSTAAGSGEQVQP